MKVLLIALMALVAFPAWAEDWKTSDGKIYVGVKVVRIEDDAVTIIYKEGGALVPIFKLPPDLQKKFSYDPEKAKIAAAARMKADAENAKELQAEIDLAAKMKKKQQIDTASKIEHAQAP